MQVKFELFSEPVLILAAQPNISNTLKLVTLTSHATIKLWSYKILQDSEGPSLTPLADLTGHDKQVGNIVWSPNGKHILTTCDFAMLWDVDELNCKKLKKYSPELGEIYSVVWSPDSGRFAVGYYNEILAVHNINNGTEQKQKLEYSARALSWDPLDRYIAILSFDNNVCLRKTTALDMVFKRISLNVRCSKFTDNLTKRPERKIAWSPDCAYLMCPSYEDMKEIPIVCALSRKKDFEIEYVIAGPSSSISCIAFQETIYKNEDTNTEYCIFAMGDSDGNISIWKSNNEGSPLKYIKGGSDEISIDSLSWSKDGTLLFATTTKRFVIVIKFNKELLGKPLNQEQRDGLLLDKYGMSQALPQQPDRGLNFMDMRMKASVAPTANTATKMLIESSQLPNAKDSTPMVQSNALSQPTPQQQKPSILQMEKTKDGKKKYVVVSKTNQVPSSSQPKPATVGNLTSTNPIPNPTPTQSEMNIEARLQGPSDQSKQIEDSNKIQEEPPSLKKPSAAQDDLEDDNATPRPKRTRSSHTPAVEKNLPVPQVIFEKPAPIEKYHQIKLKEFALEIDIKKNVLENTEEMMTLVRCVGISVKNIKHILWMDFIEGKILLYQTNSKLLCYYTDAHYLYMNSLSNGRKYELPIISTNVVMMKLNERNDIMLIKNTGDLKIYNIDTKQTILEENVASMIKELSGTYRCSLENIHLDEAGTPYLYIRSNLVVFYNKQLQGWQKVDQLILGLGIFKDSVPFEKKSELIFKTQTYREKFHEFMTRICPDSIKPEELSFDKKASIICKLEEALLYCMSKDDVKAYIQVADIYIVKLAQFMEYNRIRQFLLEDLWKKQNEKDYIFLKKHSVDTTQLLLHYKDVVSGLAIGGNNRELLELISEIRILTETIDFMPK